MSKSEYSSNQADYLQKVVALSVKDEKFRNTLPLNPKEAINSMRKVLQFDYDDLSEQSVEIIASFTSEELDTLRRIFLRAKKVGVDLEPVKMF